MKTIFFKEIRINLKNFLIWSLGGGLLGLSCILLYKSMQGDMKDMATGQTVPVGLTEDELAAALG